MGEAGVNSGNERLDKLVKTEQRNKCFLVLLLSFIVLVTVSLLIRYAHDEPITEVKGVVIGIDSTNWSGPYDEHFYIIIRTESGETARYEIPRESLVKIGDTVLVSPYTFRQFGK